MANLLFNNTSCIFYLINEPTPETLLAAADVLETAPDILETAPDTTNMNKKFAKAIRQFLPSEGIISVANGIYNIL